MYRFILSLRYLRSRKITYFSIAGVAVGVMALIVVLSVMEGFQRDFKSRIRGLLSDLSMRYRGDEPLDEVLRKIESVPHVTGASPRLRGMAILGGRGRGGVETVGVDPAREGAVSELPVYVLDALLDRASSRATLYVEETFFQVQDMVRRLERIEAESGSKWEPSDREDFLRRIEGARVFLRALQGILNELREERGFAVVRRAYQGFLQAFRDLGVLDPKGMERIESEVRVQMQGLERDQAAYEEQRRKYGGGGFPLPFSGPDAEEVLVGEELATRQLKVLAGESVQMVTGSARALPSARDARTRGDFKVVGTFKSGMYKVDAGSVFLPLGTAQSFSGREGLVSEIAIRLDDFSHAEEAKARLAALFPDQEVRTWAEQRKSYLQAIRLEKSFLAVVLFMIVVVAGFNMLATFLMMVSEKVRDLGILKALGGHPAGITSVFLLTSALIGVVGAGVGAAAGLAIASYINEIEAFARGLGIPTPFPRDLYYLNRIPVVLQGWEIAWIVGPTVVFSILLGGLLPALRAARLDPLEALRYE
ncbi:MAG: ABC transporter permease [Planctomycetes bacterium]|nr:ABC transporter permease [Planctomycetota bacterium]